MATNTAMTTNTAMRLQNLVYFPQNNPGNTIEVKYSGVLLTDVLNGNPQGDPDNGNIPRINFDDERVDVTDSGFKRRFRDHVEDLYGSIPGMNIWVSRGVILEDEIMTSRREAGFHAEPTSENLEEGAETKGKTKGKGKERAKSADEVKDTGKVMLRRNWDYRVFGGVASIGANAGKAKGAAQIMHTKSVSPAQIVSDTITRVCISDRKRSEKMNGANQDMGTKHYVRYALLKTNFFISPQESEKNGMTYADFDILVESMLYAPSSQWSGCSAGTRQCRGLIIFKHSTRTGEISDLSHLVRCRLKDPSKRYPLGFDDYIIEIDDPPPGVEVLIFLDPRKS
jgi:CRISPR-associated protein Csd2